jgi:CRISPR/Cas system CSM-associated protein Csm4 (group 5 of RAMP superfamily)
MRLYRLKLQPRSAWLTPWQADTLAGLLCWSYARTSGEDALCRDVIVPASNGEPPFVLSDAFPGDLLPLPTSLRLVDWAPSERKDVKRARWLRPDTFRRAQSGENIASAELLSDDVFHKHAQVRNTLDRYTNTTGGPGSLFSLGETALNEKSDALGSAHYLSVYARVIEGFEDTLLSLFEEAASIGFGADISVGKGQFDLLSGLEPVELLDNLEREGSGLICLSTFQPGSSDPTDGLWKAFTKFGKVGPDFGLENVFKRPLIMLRAGACFFGTAQREFIGRAVPMDQLLSPDNCEYLQAKGINLLHYAYGLTVPASF